MKYNNNIINIIIILSVSFVKCAKNKAWPNCDEKWPSCVADKLGRNTVCISHHCGGRGVDRCIEIKPGPMMRRATLEGHNDKRDLVASGGDPRNGMTSAADMRAFSYDLGLEYTAICHVNRCKMEHDKCRGSKKFPDAGQNLAKQKFDPRSPYVREVLNVNVTRWYVQNWYNTEILLNPDWTASIKKYFFEHATGHLTQLVWANTTHIGCSRAMWNKSNIIEYHITCNYAPAGNILTLPMFTIGKACTACPNGTQCNKRYTSLCGEVDDSKVDTGENPYRKDDATQSRPPPFVLASGLFILILQCII